MRVALISYEFPPDTAWGGISTYVSQIARSLVAHGADVEVFCGSTARTDSFVADGARVHRVQSDRDTFPAAVASAFKRRHQQRRFDVIEGPDYMAEASEVVRAAPEVPYVVKLHTPYRFVASLNRGPLTWEKIRAQLRLLWYVLKTRDPSVLITPEHRIFQAEKQNLHLADEVVAPSRAIARMIGRKWKIEPSRLSLIPLAYEPPQALLDIPVETETRRISYVGRLECRKGVEDLAKAIPLVLRKHPYLRFRFVGAVGLSSEPGVDMKSFILRTVPDHLHAQLEFTGNVPPDEIPRYLAETDICVFPSHWESFGFVVLDAMAAGRAIVCTGNSGMAELLNNGEFGLLIPPKKPIAIARSLSRLHVDPMLRHNLGRKARHEGLVRYAHGSIAPLQLSSYERAIARKKRQLRAEVPRRWDLGTWLIDQIQGMTKQNAEEAASRLRQPANSR